MQQARKDKKQRKFEEVEQRQIKSVEQKKLKNSSVSIRKRARRDIDWAEWDDLAAE